MQKEKAEENSIRSLRKTMAFYLAGLHIHDSHSRQQKRKDLGGGVTRDEMKM